MKDEIKLFSELKANWLFSYISDKFRLKSLAYLAEIFERFKDKRKGYKHHLASRRICKNFIRSCKTDFVK